MLQLWARVDLGAMAMKGVLCIPQSSSTAGTFLSDCLVSYPGHSLGSYPSAEVQSVYSTAPANWARTLMSITSVVQSGPRSNGNEELLHIPQTSMAGASQIKAILCHIQDIGGRVLLLCRDVVCVFYKCSQLGWKKWGYLRCTL